MARDIQRKPEIYVLDWKVYLLSTGLLTVTRLLGVESHLCILS